MNAQKLQKSLSFLLLLALLLTGCAGKKDNEAFFSETRRYLTEKAEPAWLPAFADAVDCAGLYDAYCAAGGAANDPAAFAAYIAEHAEPAENWQALFTEAFAVQCEYPVARFESAEDGLWRVYVTIDDAEVPYVAVDPLTGWYHG